VSRTATGTASASTLSSPCTRPSSECRARCGSEGGSDSPGACWGRRRRTGQRKKCALGPPQFGPACLGEGVRAPPSEGHVLGMCSLSPTVARWALPTRGCHRHRHRGHAVSLRMLLATCRSQQCYIPCSMLHAAVACKPACLHADHLSPVTVAHATRAPDPLPHSSSPPTHITPMPSGAPPSATPMT
jgi:hypothetical protein